MKTLFLDTSSNYLSLSIYQSSAIIYSNSVLLKSRFNEELLSIIDFAFKSLKIDIRDIDEFYVVVGPGSFTGIRIGVSTILGLSLSTGRPLYGITSLDAAALRLNKDKNVDKISVATKLRLNEYAYREYDFKENKFSDYLVIKEDEISSDTYVLNKKYIDLTRCYEHSLFKDFLRGYEPFYMRKSQAEINFDKACGL
ncbi:tRNA (adenosine(37)-N6)-threonylcarbamoyltransferase complex dimerization subunit type 1 TsaB [Deferribacter autotrophicus]|uniref:tRNA (Adenosine(37)-N6)-threonylcarbamoyltransferase complex dimerization subunit type 1 TsaB n=1 Tax=Deferribacter autotrophicus TaxID=500465 RepID=A0A5A8F3N2_9BACT|nr:tRNA (adenosine(37)-N6)-threonylcarbamoyltransferase complex dimerization subunit type 1 TsaB [Deferribacter autotrophicus]KAA0258071.1 tRNA (adenosine(37)-N6)-threonylcarbamoyltransferase complex dimerization subunit type 1 TsaB [Deferribacter autotrophicus]